MYSFFISLLSLSLLMISPIVKVNYEFKNKTDEKVEALQNNLNSNKILIVPGFDISSITSNSIFVNITGNRNDNPGIPSWEQPPCGAVYYTMSGLGLNNPNLSNGSRTIGNLSVSRYTVIRHYTELFYHPDINGGVWICGSYTDRATFETLGYKEREVSNILVVPSINYAKVTFNFKQNNADSNLLYISNREINLPIQWIPYYAHEGLNTYTFIELKSNAKYIFEIQNFGESHYSTLFDLIPTIFEFTNNDFLGRDWALFEYKYIKNDDDGKIWYKNYLKNDYSEEIEWILWREYSDGNETTDFWFNDGYDLKPNKDYVLELALNSNGDGLIKKEYKTQGKDSVLERNNDDHIFQTEAALGFKLTLNDGDGYIDYKYGLLNQEMENSEWIRLNPNSPYEVDTEGHIILYNLIPNTEYVLWISCDDGETHNSFSFSTLPLGSNIEFNGDINLVGNMAIVPVKLTLNNGNGLIEYKYIPTNWSDDSSNWIYWNTYSKDYNFSITLQDLLPKTEYRVLIRVDGISQITQTFTSR